MRERKSGDKRGSTRQNVPVYIEAFEETFPLGTLVNVSPEGLFVQSTEPKEVGTLIDLSFQLPDSERWIHLKTRVIWVNPPPSFSTEEPFVSSGRPVFDIPGMGLTILSAAPESKALLQKFMQNRKGTA
jgi:hypothetical protein